MGYFSLDIKKAKGSSDTVQSDHIERRIIPKNADPTRTHLNRVLIEYPDGVLSNQTGNNGMDCRKAESAVAQDGEIVCTYSGDEAVLFVDFDKQSKRVSSKNFEIMGLVGWL